MGLFSHRQKNVEVRPEQKWDYITLRDFKSTSCFTPFAYIYLYFSLGLSISVYAVDTFTAVNLLVFNRWSSEISPTQLISFTASKWIFSICIILSFLNVGYEHIRAQRIMRRGSVAESYLDNLAVRLESIRWGKGLGWKRFLVFAELTKSKKGAEYIALFTYFSFQSWIRVLLCSGPRQAVNALTLVSVYNAQLAVAGGNNVGNTLLDFFGKIRDLFEHNTQEALILSGMIFTLVIWVFSFLSLLLAFCFFIFFLWSYIPRSDGGLSGYCSRKINKRLMKIVASKVNTAIAEEDRRRKKAELKAAQQAGTVPPPRVTATIPNVGTADDKLPGGSSLMLQRNDTMATLPPYTSRPGTSASNSFELSNMDQKQPLPRPMPPTRTGTMASMSSMSGAPQKSNFSTRASLLSYAAEPGRSASPAPSISMVREMDAGNRSMPGYSNNVNNYGPSIVRPGTAASNHSFGPGGPGGAPQFAQLSRTNTGGSMAFNNNAPSHSYSGNNAADYGYLNNGYSESPMRSTELPPAPAPVYGNGSTGAPDNYSNSYSNSYSNNYSSDYANDYANGYPNGHNGSQANSREYGHNPSNSSSSNRYMPFRPDDNTGRASPAPSARQLGPGPGPGQRSMASPMRSVTQPNFADSRSITPSGDRSSNGHASPYGPPQRNMTAPVPPMGGGGGYGGSGGAMNNGYAHGRQISEDSSYSSYFEQPATAASQRNPPRQPAYGNAGNGGSSWGTDVESQRGPQY